MKNDRNRFTILKRAYDLLKDNPDKSIDSLAFELRTTVRTVKNVIECLRYVGIALRTTPRQGCICDHPRYVHTYKDGCTKCDCDASWPVKERHLGLRRTRHRWVQFPQENSLVPIDIDLIRQYRLGGRSDIADKLLQAHYASIKKAAKNELEGIIKKDKMIRDTFKKCECGNSTGSSSKRVCPECRSKKVKRKSVDYNRDRRDEARLNGLCAYCYVNPVGGKYKYGCKDCNTKRKRFYQNRRNKLLGVV